MFVMDCVLQKRNQRWRPAQRTYGAVLPEAVANDLLNREFTESDYELLTQLDRYVYVLPIYIYFKKRYSDIDAMLEM